MIKHVAFGRERLVAALFVADEGSDIIMNPAMDLQVLFLAETLAAGRKLALEGLSPVMKVQVCSEADTAFEVFVAAWERAHEGGFGLPS